METPTPSTTDRSRARSIAAIAWLATAAGTMALVETRLAIPLLPRDGGIPRALALAFVRTPELFVLLGVLASLTWGTALVRGPRVRTAADLFAAVLASTALAAVLALLPPPHDEAYGWVSTELTATAHPRLVATLATDALLVQSLLIAVAHIARARREAGWRAALLAPSASVLVAWAALAADLQLPWWARSNDEMLEIVPHICTKILAAASVLALAQIALTIQRRRAEVSNA